MKFWVHNPSPVVQLNLNHRPYRYLSWALVSWDRYVLYSQGKYWRNGSLHISLCLQQSALPRQPFFFKNRFGQTKPSVGASWDRMRRKRNFESKIFKIFENPSNHSELHGSSYSVQLVTQLFATPTKLNIGYVATKRLLSTCLSDKQIPQSQ